MHDKYDVIAMENLKPTFSHDVSLYCKHDAPPFLFHPKDWDALAPIWVLMLCY